MDIKLLGKLLHSSSSISNLRIPILLVGLLGLIPGFLDESLVGVGSLLAYAVIALFRGQIRKKRNKIIARINEEKNAGTITELEMKDILKSLNALTIAGGENRT